MRVKSLVLMVVLLAASRTITAQVDTEALAFCDVTAIDQHLMLEDTYGFSVSFVDNATAPYYRLYAIGDFNRFKWENNLIRDVALSSDPLCTQIPAPHPPQVPSPGGYMYAPPDFPPYAWDPRCVFDNVGLFSKTVLSASSNDIWDAYPGTQNVSTSPRQTPAPPEPAWPRSDIYGTTGFTPIFSRTDLNNAFPSPPPTTNYANCHPYDPVELATATSNSKPVQVFYSGGVNRWFMVFNGNINNYSPGITGNDIWRVYWASSIDGANGTPSPWTIDPQMLFRSVVEQYDCGGGLLVTDMMIDNDYFYVLLTEVGHGLPDSYRSYLFRAQIDANSASLPGYTGGWWVASYPLTGAYPNTDYTWKEVTLGSQLDLQAMNAVAMQPTRVPSNKYGASVVKQASVARVFDASGDVSRYYMVTADRSQIGDPVELWGSDSLAHPFQFEGNLDTTSLNEGGAGWEFSFAHYTNNYPASQPPGGTPRIRRLNPDLWYVQNVGPGPGNFSGGGLTASRRRIDLSPRICVAAAYTPAQQGPPYQPPYCQSTLWTPAGTPNLKAFVTPQAGATYLWQLTGGTITGPTNSSSVTFTASSTPGTRMILSVKETQPSGSCHPNLQLTSTASMMVDFLDNSPGSFHDDIARLGRDGVSGGCDGSGDFCPTSPIQRDQMSVFLLKGKYGPSYSPPACTGIFHADVPCPSTFAAWVEEAYNENIMDACPAPPTFCPSTPVTRSAMAPFLLKAQRPIYPPPNCATTVFADVPCPGGTNVNWINLLSAEGITAGCGGGNYCPAASITRGQMAVFINKTFRLP